MHQLIFILIIWCFNLIVTLKFKCKANFSSKVEVLGATPHLFDGIKILII